jgi:hypothetical protein
VICRHIKELDLRPITGKKWIQTDENFGVIVGVIEKRVK